MVLTKFQLKDKQGKRRFFQEIFLVADTAIEVVLKMPFLALSKVEINFAKRELNWRTYNLNEALPTTKQVQTIDPKEIAAVALVLNKEAFVVYVAYLRAKMSIHLAWEAQIVSLFTKEVSVPKEYADFSNIFFKESAAVLSKRLDINKHVINLEPGK